MTDESEKTLP